MPKVVPYNPLAAMAALAAQAGAVQGYQQQSQQGFQNAMQIQQYNNQLQQADENKQMQQQQIGNQVSARNQEAQISANRLAAQQQQQQEENDLRRQHLAQQLEAVKLNQEGQTQRQQDRISSAEEIAQSKTNFTEDQINQAGTLIDTLQKSGVLNEAQAGQMRTNLLAGRNISSGGVGGSGDIARAKFELQKKDREMKNGVSILQPDIDAAKEELKSAESAYNSMMKSTAYARARPDNPRDAQLVKEKNLIIERLKKAKSQLTSRQEDLQYFRGFMNGGQQQIDPAIPGTTPSEMSSSQAPTQVSQRPNPNANVQIGASRKLVTAIVQKVGADKEKVRQAIIEMGLNPDLPIYED
jgi:hypothetical protein